MRHQITPWKRPARVLLGLGLLACASSSVWAAPAAETKKATPRQEPRLAKTDTQNADVLDKLYERLAKAESAEQAKVLTIAIERVWLHSGSVTVDLLMNRAMGVHGEGDTTLAMKLLDSLVRLEPKFPEAWNRRAFFYFKDGKYPQALADLRHVLLLDPRHYMAIQGLSNILRELGDAKLALKALRRAIAVNPYLEGGQTMVKELEREVEGQGI